MNELHNKRIIYNKDSLEEKDITSSPFDLFEHWYHLAEENSFIEEPNAMSLSTIENIKNINFPRTRMVLLKKFSVEGFEFYTNYESRKGKSIKENKNICLSFYWPTLEKQIIINGIAEKLSEKISEEYFHSRPKGSQLGAIISKQSKIIPNGEYLEIKLKEKEEEYKDLSILPKPEKWGGYIVKPIQIEFWQGRPNRLHDRILYTKISDIAWKIERLSP